MIFGSCASGIEAASVAWTPLGWKAVWFSEIARFPCALLAARYPDVPNLGDMRTIHERPEFNEQPIDLLCGGTPCQDFSIAGTRKGLGGGRGELTRVFSRIAYRKRPRWFTWENVPGVFANNGGWDFGTILACFAGYPDGCAFAPPRDGWRNSGVAPGNGAHGYGVAWRVLDAQYFGVPQQRRRVFVVGYLGDWRRAAAVLFDLESMSGNPAPRQEEGDTVAGTISARFARNGGAANDDVIGGRLIPTGPGGLPISHALSARDMKGPCTNLAQTTLVAKANSIRKLVPRECERLQGFPDDWTLIKHRRHPAKDTPRYHALGNSQAVPVMRWLGERIAMVDTIP